MEVSDELVVMNKGRVEQVGTPAEIYDNPASSFVMSFIGPVNVLSPLSGLRLHHGNWADRDSFLPESFGDRGLSEKDLRVFLRPRDVRIQFHPTEESVPAKVDRIIHLGWEIQVELVLTETEQVVTAHLNREEFDRLQLQPHQAVYVQPKQVRVFADVPV